MNNIPKRQFSNWCIFCNSSPLPLGRGDFSFLFLNLLLTYMYRYATLCNERWC